VSVVITSRVITAAMMKLIGDTGAVIIKIPAAYVEGFLPALKG